MFRELLIDREEITLQVLLGRDVGSINASHPSSHQVSQFTTHTATTNTVASAIQTAAALCIRVDPTPASGAPASSAEVVATRPASAL